MLAIDKPAGWMLAPEEWQETGRNLFAALTSSIRAGDFWARSRNLKYLRHVHRLDADTSGVLLMAKSPGALAAYGRLFESRQVEKIYLAVVQNEPKQGAWVCRLRLAADPKKVGIMKVDAKAGKETETHFRVLQTGLDAKGGRISLILARPITGRTHQIRVHLAESGTPVIGDRLYGDLDRSPDDCSNSGMPKTGASTRQASRARQDARLALRAVKLSYANPFTRRQIRVLAPADQFLSEHGLGEIPDRFHDLIL